MLLGKALNLGYLWRRALVYFMLLWTKTSSNYRHMREISAHLVFGKRAESPARPSRSGNVFKTPPHAEVRTSPKTIFNMSINSIHICFDPSNPTQK